jgi:hypothetical protein
VGVSGACVVFSILLAAGSSSADATRFREAGEAARAGDHPKAIGIYRELASSGLESASLYWNWAQSAIARGETGEALWALLRGREVDPGDRAVAREIERLREGANLDAAEISPDPLAAVARQARRFRLDLAGLAFLGISLALQGLAARAPARLSMRAARAVALAAGLACSAAALAGGGRRPTGVAITATSALLDAASPTAAQLGALREGEVLPILETSGAYVRVEDSAGARGWASTEDVRRLDSAPR